MTYRSSKTYGHEIGLSCCFRQWRAASHCRFLHGYALSVHLEFEADELDDNNWVVDFGSLKPVKALLEKQFDHKTLVAVDDPHLAAYRLMVDTGIAQVMIVPKVGCEAFAELIYKMVAEWLADVGYAPRVRLSHVTVREHGANSASYSGVL